MNKGADRGGLASLALLLSLVLVTGQARAGAWMREPGETLAIAKLRETFVSGRFDDLGARVEDDPYRKHEADLWVERGIGPRLTGLAGLLVQDVDEAGDAGQGHRVEASLGGRLRLLETGRLAVAAEGRLFVPNHALAREQGFLETGHVEGEARLLGGYAFEAFGRYGYVDLQTAWRPRDDGFADLLQVSATTGIPLWGPVEVTLGGRTLLEVEDGFSEPLSERHEASAAVIVSLGERWAVEAGILATVAGRHTPADLGASFGLWRRF